jgi:NAD(P)-dependent dehydrogenase (short-subunit alcohol dehydrogenase family)
MTVTAAGELGPKRIRVNTISPGPVSTNVLIDAGLTREQVDGFEKRAASLLPLGRVGTPADVASVVLFFADDAQSGWVTGSDLVIDGGLLTRSAMA